MGEVITATDALFRPVISDAQKAQVRASFATLPPGKRAAILVIADLNGTARGQLAARIGNHWQVAAGAGFAIGQRPSGFIGIEGSF